LEGVSSRLIGVVTDLLESYRIPGEQTDLAGMADRCGQLGSDPGALFGVVQGQVLHEYAFRRSGLAIAPDQLADWDVSAGQVLEQALRLDPAPLPNGGRRNGGSPGSASTVLCSTARCSATAAFRPGHRSGECPLPGSLTSTGRGRQPKTGSCIVLPVDTAPCTSTSTQLAHSRSRPNACSPDSLCLMRHEAEA
jgi:hypothetical protein